MIFRNFDENGNQTSREIDQETVRFEDLKRESLIALLYGLRDLLVFEDDEDDEDDDDESDSIYEAQELLKQYEPRLPEVNYLNEFLKDVLGEEDAQVFFDLFEKEDQLAGLESSQKESE